MKILVTGGAGFVGRHLVNSLRSEFGNHAEIFLTSKSSSETVFGISVSDLNVTDEAAVSAAIQSIRPSHIVHLAGVAAVSNASAHPIEAWQTHVFGTLNLANAILKDAPDCMLISVGTGQVYGSSAQSGTPLTESALLNPNNDYAVTKAATDLALGAYAERGLRCVRLRPFNHTGPGQSEDFVIPSFAMQIARIEAGQSPPRISVGNLDAERDFLDVRDVTAAYAKVIKHSAELESGTILNIASGVPRRIGDALNRLIEISGTPIAIHNDAARMRAADIQRFVGNSEVARSKLQWRPSIEFEQTLRDVLDFSRETNREKPALTDPQFTATEPQ